MNIFRDIILRFLIIPKCIKKFLSFFMQYQSFFPSFTKKNYMNELWTIFVQYHTECMLETSKFTVLRSSTLLESIKLSARTLDAEHRERLTLFFFSLPPFLLFFFFSLTKNECIERERRSIISRDCLSSLDEIAGSVSGFVFRPIFTLKNRDIRCYDRCLSSS